jgi:hypothetical protein
MDLNFSFGSSDDDLFRIGESEQPHNSSSRQFLENSAEFSFTAMS